MIGRVLFEVGGSPAEAVLGDDGKWTVSVDTPDNARVNQILTDDLNINHNLDDYSPADGQPGYLQLQDVAREWNGRVDAPPVPPTDPGLVY